jgi:carbonic anhydrase
VIDALTAFDRLQAGNLRFASGRPAPVGQSGGRRSATLRSEQAPFAIVLGCADSRVPPELVFGQSLGQIYVVRVAGNIVTPALVGSIEFAAAGFKTPLAVVLGHSQCAAVLATLLQHPETAASGLRPVVERIQPAVAGLLSAASPDHPELVMPLAVAANVRASVRQLRTGSPVLQAVVEQGKLVVVGAVFSHETGLVEFIET